MRVVCPVCGAELSVRFTPRGRPVGGLYEVVLIHRGHCAKLIIDEQRFVRRATEIDCIHADELSIYIDGDKALVYTKVSTAEIPAEYIKTTVETELQIKSWRTET